MPISKVEFHTAVEKGVVDLMDRVHAFLATDRDEAYSERELVERLGLRTDRETQAALREALRSLEGLEAIRWGIVGDADYYIFNRDFPSAAPRR
jgi:hypothetical protein